MNRFLQQGRIFDQRRFFKVVCGAGNEDPEEVFRLSLVYTLAGALGIDLSANPEVVRAGRRGIELALELAPELGVSIETRPFITVSVGLKGDPHVRKAVIDSDRCTDCGACQAGCEQLAVTESPHQIIAQRCIGCGKCGEVCDFDAVSFYTRKVDFETVIPDCLAAGAENLELHAIVPDDKKVVQDWDLLNRLLPDHYISMCLDRSHLSNTHLLDRIRMAKEVTGNRLIIQADGAPMSGGFDDYNTTLQAVAIADIIMKSGIDTRILLSGGTNSRSGELARMCGIHAHGVSIGTFARNLIRDEISDADFNTNIKTIRKAVYKASELVRVNLEPMSGPV